MLQILFSDIDRFIRKKANPLQLIKYSYKEEITGPDCSLNDSLIIHRKRKNKKRKEDLTSKIADFWNL